MRNTMTDFGRFYLDKEKDIIVDLRLDGERMYYTLRTPNHHTGNLIRNLAKLCALPVTEDVDGLLIIDGEVPCYVDAYNRRVYVFRLGDTKVANIYADSPGEGAADGIPAGTTGQEDKAGGEPAGEEPGKPGCRVELKASIPSIAKTLMSQTKDYRGSLRDTVIKSYILNDCKFRTDLHTHMNGNLAPDVLIALGIAHQIRYPLYYIRKLELRLTESQKAVLRKNRAEAERQFRDSPLTGKYLRRKIDDNTFINFADLILNNPDNAAWNLARIRDSLAVLKDGQAVFTNLEKVYLYRYIFTKGVPHPEKIALRDIGRIPDADIAAVLSQCLKDRRNPAYRGNSLFQDKLLWIARNYRSRGIVYAEISDTTLVKPDAAPAMLKAVHEVMPAVTAETGVVLRFLAAIRRIPLTIVKDSVTVNDYAANLRTIRAVAPDPYVAGADIVGEEINDIRELSPVIGGLVDIAGGDEDFVIRIHAGENDSLKDNVANSVRCVKEALSPGQKMPHLRIGHGLYTADLRSPRGRQLIAELAESRAVLEFQLTSNVRLNNLSSLARHPLKQYLEGGVMCVQGTDGGALYGTDSIDEEIALERLLRLSRGELLFMRASEDRILEASLEAFRRKMREFPAGNPEEAEEYLARRVRESGSAGLPWELQTAERLDAAEELAGQIKELPGDRRPVILSGGSFNSDRHATRMTEEGRRLVESLVSGADPARDVFVIGHTLSGYERCLLEKNRGRIPVYAFVPSEITAAERAKLKKSGVFIRVAIEPAGMGIYKSIAYEIFRRMPSVLIALDGNSAGANLIQEARNGRFRCRILVYGHSRVLRAKAESLGGYVAIFERHDDCAILNALNYSHPEEGPV